MIKTALHCISSIFLSWLTVRFNCLYLTYCLFDILPCQKYRMILGTFSTFVWQFLCHHCATATGMGSAHANMTQYPSSPDPVRCLGFDSPLRSPLATALSGLVSVALARQKQPPPPHLPVVLMPPLTEKKISHSLHFHSISESWLFGFKSCRRADLGTLLRSVH